MTLLFAGTSPVELPAFAGRSTLEGQISPHVAEGVIPHRTDFMPVVVGLAAPDIWVSFWFGSSGSFSTSPTSGNTDLVTLVGPGNYRLHSQGGTLRLQTGATVLVDSGQDLVRFVRHRIDLHLRRHPTEGVFEVFVDGVSRARLDGDTGTGATTGVGFGSGNTSGTQHVSGVIVADEDTRPLEYAQLDLTGPGTFDGMDGELADVTGPLDDGSFYSATEPGQRQSFTTAALPGALQTGYAVSALVVSARMRGDRARARVLIAHAGHEATGPDLALFGGHQLVQGIFAQHPDGTDWTVAGAEAAEVGVEVLAP